MLYSNEQHNKPFTQASKVDYRLADKTKTRHAFDITHDSGQNWTNQ